MKLVMYVGNDFIAAVPLEKERITQPGYVGSLKRERLEQHAEVVVYASQEPDFLVVRFPIDFSVN